MKPRTEAGRHQRMAFAEWTPPREFDEYRLLERIGHGAMGQVWLGRDTLLDRPVAIKFIRFDDDSVAARERCLIEARAAARVQHPNVVAVHRVGLALGHPYTVTELLEGKTLDALDLPLSSERVLELGVQLARGLAAAHRRGVLHRDLKPANAFLTDQGEVKILDFGLAKLSDSDADMAAMAAPMLPRPPLLSATGAVMGTPLYMAPESWAGTSATPATDVYALGGLLYELLAGKPPPAYLPPGPIDEIVRTYGVRPLAEVAPLVNADLARVVERCLSLDPSARYPSGDAVREALEALVTPELERGRPAGNPYRGLLCFEAEHRALFFGRHAEGRAVLERLKSDGCVVVIADSGAGKSSLCRAAVLPACAEGALGEGRSWACATLVPGRHPLSALASALGAAMGSDEVALQRAIESDPESIPSLVRRELGADRGVVLFVDQLEELATVDASPAAERDKFLRTLMAFCARRPGVRVLATMRSDLLGRMAALSPELPAILSRSLLFLGPPSPEGLRNVVTGPARLQGFSFESDETVQALVAFGGKPGALPLLQFALTELWEARDDEQRLLPRAALDRLGGAEGALARHADQILARLSPEEGAAAREILLLLVAADDTRRRTPHEELVRDDASRQAALDALSRDRLVVARGGPGGDGYELAHEALATAWPTLREWLDDDADARSLRDRLERAAAEWDRLQRPPEALWGRAQLAELQRLTQWPAAAAVASFVRASRREEQRRLLRLPAIGAALVMAAVVAWGGTALLHRRHLSAQIAERWRQGDEAAEEARALEAEWQRARAEAYRAFDQGHWKQGEERWGRARAKEAPIEPAVRRATAAYESAVLLDSSRTDTRVRLADWFIERALSADDVDDVRRRDALVARAELLDDTGTRTARLREPVHVSLSVEPTSARVQISRYRLENSRYLLEDPRDFAEGDFARGSYVLELTAPGYAPVRLPILLTRGDPRVLSVRMIPASKLPSGFIHIPAGRFLFGAPDGNEVARTYSEAAPIHPVEVGEYLISRDELTYGEYFAYLRASSPSERRKHLPSAVSARPGRSAGLTEQPGPFELTVCANGACYPLSEKDLLVYPARHMRGVQNWSKLPVRGVTVDDLDAYAQWADRTGKIPGARLCTEYEWERAARGADSRIYPHGDQLAPEEANYDETYYRTEGAFGPDEVGSHPASNSPFGVADLVGNASEFVRPAHQGGRTVVRGGSYTVTQLSSRSITRDADTPSYGMSPIGGRLCADVTR